MPWHRASAKKASSSVAPASASPSPPTRCPASAAKATRLHNNANVLALGALVTGPGLALEIVDIFLDTPFSEEERHSRRVSQLEEE